MTTHCTQIKSYRPASGVKSWMAWKQRQQRQQQQMVSCLKYTCTVNPCLFSCLVIIHNTNQTHSFLTITKKTWKIASNKSQSNYQLHNMTVQSHVLKSEQILLIRKPLQTDAAHRGWDRWEVTGLRTGAYIRYKTSSPNTLVVHSSRRTLRLFYNPPQCLHSNSTIEHAGITHLYATQILQCIAKQWFCITVIGVQHQVNLMHCTCPLMISGWKARRQQHAHHA